MEKFGNFVKGCFGTSQDKRESADDENRPKPRPVIDPEDGFAAESLEEEAKTLVDLKDVYGLFVSEAQDAWGKILNSLILKVREGQEISFSDSFDGNSMNSSSNGIGKEIFRHGLSTEEIHKFFFELDPKRCGMPMNKNQNSPVPFTATLKTVQTNGRQAPVVTRSGSTSGSMEVFLNDQEKAIYKRVLQCANYPVLGSPSGEPSVTPCGSGDTAENVNIDGATSASLSDGASAMSPTDAISIDPGMMMKLLMDSFGIRVRMHERYYTEMKKSIPQRDPSKLLLCELQDRLYRLETNSDNFYRVNSFINPDGYSKWRKRELEHTKALIRRFWKKEVPRNLGMGVGQVNAHKEYMMLQNKLFEFEMKNRIDMQQNSAAEHATSVFPISTAARKVLKEYGLRYGVCSLYRQIAALVCMAEKFENSSWFIKFATRAVFQVDKILKSCDVMVEEERDMLEHALDILHRNVEYTFKKIRKLCPAKINFDTITWILEMLNAILKIKEYLGLLEDDDCTVEKLVRGYIEEGVKEGYNKCKDLAIIDNENGAYSSGTNPKTLITLVHDIRKEFKFYEELSKKCPDLKRYFDVTDVVANTLYRLCMKDVRELMVRRTQTIQTADVDVKVLKLAYRLAKLDSDWSSFIAPSSQKWRVDFMLEMHVIMTAISESSRNKVRSFLTKDKWKTIEFSSPEAGSESSRVQSREQVRERGNTLVSLRSLVQSEGSAFSKPRPMEKSNAEKPSAGKREPYENNSTEKSGAEKPRPTEKSGHAEKSAENYNAGKSRAEELQPSEKSGPTEKLSPTENARLNEKVENTKAEKPEATQDPKKDEHKIDDTSTSISRDRSYQHNSTSIVGNENMKSCSNTAVDEGALIATQNTVRHEGRNENIDDEVFENNMGSSNEPCGNTQDDMNTFVGELLDDVSTYVERLEDFQIDFYVNKILEESLRVVRQETTTQSTAGSECRNLNTENDDGPKRSGSNIPEGSLDPSVPNNGNVMDENDNESLEDFDTEVACTLVNVDKSRMGTRQYDSPIREYHSDEHDSSEDGLKRPFEKISKMDSSTEGVQPLKIPARLQTSEGRRSAGGFIAVREEIADYDDVDAFEVPPSPCSPPDNRPKSFSLPASDFMSLRNKAIRNDMPKTKSDQSIDSFCAYDEDSVFESTPQPKGKAFVSKLSSNLESGGGESETRSNDSEAGESNTRPSTLNTERLSSISALPREGRILVSSSSVDVLTLILRASGFYSQLCDTLAPSKLRVNPQNREVKAPSEIIRDNFAFGLVTNIRDLLVTYGDALLALDICGLDDQTLSEILGPKLHLRIKNKQNEGLISGCRHDRNRRMSTNAARQGTQSEFCPEVSKIIRYCIGEWESITPEMCTRLNNTRSLIDLLPLIEDTSKQMCFGCNVNGVSGQDGKIIWPDSNLNDSLCPPLTACRKNLQAVWLAQARILAYRVAYMLEKVVDILLSLSLKWMLKAPYKEQMRPVSVFLEHQMKMLHRHLNPVSVQAVVKALWNKVILILHGYAKDLRTNKTDPKYNAERYMQLISVLLRHLVVDKETGDNLLNRCRAVLLRFRLHSLPSSKLEVISDMARNLESESGNLSRTLTAKEILLDIKANKLLPKIFSGTKFVNILVNNASWLREFRISLGMKKTEDRELAYLIGKALYKSQMIACVETPDHNQEPNIRRIISPQKNSSRVKIGGRVLSFSHSKEPTISDDSYNDDDDDDDTEERFHESEDYLYTVSTKYCNDSDLLVQVWRVFRETGKVGTEFAHVIHSDVVSILEYRAFWKRDKYSENILKSVAPKSVRGKAFSCPWF